MRYSREEKVNWVKLRGKGLGYYEIATQFKKDFPLRSKPNYMTIRRVIEKFERTGSVDNIYVNNRKIQRDTEIDVLAYVEVIIYLILLILHEII